MRMNGRRNMTTQKNDNGIGIYEYTGFITCSWCAGCTIFGLIMLAGACLVSFFIT
jgi:hypothetical protein